MNRTPPERFFHNLRRFDSRLAQIAADKAAPVCFYKLPPGQKSYGLVYFASTRATVVLPVRDYL